MVSFLWICYGLLAITANFVSSLEDKLRLMADFPESVHRYVTLEVH